MLDHLVGISLALISLGILCEFIPQVPAKLKQMGLICFGLGFLLAVLQLPIQGLYSLWAIRQPEYNQQASPIEGYPLQPVTDTWFHEFAWVENQQYCVETYFGQRCTPTHRTTIQWNTDVEPTLHVQKTAAGSTLYTLYLPH